MKQIWRQVKVLIVLAVIATGSAAFAAEPQVVDAVLDVPFVLVVGETGRVEPEGLEVTLRSASDDSGCLAPNDCSLATFKGTIALRLEEERDLATVQAVMGPDQGVHLDFAGYVIQFGTVRRLDKEIQATFIVTKASEEDEGKVPVM
jgi:hypothetical protein